MRLVAVLAAALLLAVAYVANGTDTKTIRAEWEYGGQATGYRLYIDGVLRCESHDGAVLMMECIVPLVPGQNTFTMTALTAAGETPHSAPFILNYTGDGPRIVNVVIKE